MGLSIDVCGTAVRQWEGGGLLVFLSHHWTVVFGAVCTIYHDRAAKRVLCR